MDSSKIHEGNEECSSNESGWTTYIVSPGGEFEEDDYENEDYSIGSVNESSRVNKKVAKEVEVDSDDSMASDASSGPSVRGISYEDVGKSRGFRPFGLFGHSREKDDIGHSREKDDKRKHVVGKKDEKKQYDGKVKGGKEKFGNKGNSAGKSKKK